ARAAMAAAWGSAPVSAAGGGSIPLVNALQTAVPKAEILLVGATDGYANIHAPDERVLLDELAKSILAEAQFFGQFAVRAT
ncbi:MAG: dipeptidase, partial [Thermoleophilaceae bacterium]